MKNLFVLFLVLVLAGCGGGGGSAGGGGGTTDTVSGVAAAGAVISGTVYLKDSAAAPKELSRTIAADGSYSFDVTGMTKPYLLKAVGTANGTSYTLYSMASDKGTANINPMTNLVVISAGGGSDPATLYNTQQAASMQAMSGKLAQAITDVQTSLNALLQAYSSATVNPISGTYKADHTGLDGMFDKVKVSVSNGTVTITNASTGATIFTAQTSNIKSGAITAGNIPQSQVSTPPISTSRVGTYKGGYTIYTFGGSRYEYGEPAVGPNSMYTITIASNGTWTGNIASVASLNGIIDDAGNMQVTNYISFNGQGSLVYQKVTASGGIIYGNFSGTALNTQPQPNVMVTVSGTIKLTKIN